MGTRKAERIALNGRFLDDVRIRLEREYGEPGSVAYAMFSKEHHRAERDDDGVTLHVHAAALLQLFVDGDVWPGPEAIDVQIGDDQLGPHVIEWLRYPDHRAGDQPVTLRLRAL